MAESRAERTENPYATYGPGDTDESWAEYFRRVKSGDVQPLVDGGELADSGEPSGGDSEPESVRRELRRGRLLEDLTDPPGALAAYVNLLIKQGFLTATGYSEAFLEGQVYGPGAKKAGEKAPDRTITYAWVSGYREDRGLVKIRYTRTNGKAWTCDFRQLNKEYRPVSDKELKAWIKNEQIETDDD